MMGIFTGLNIFNAKMSLEGKIVGIEAIETKTHCYIYLDTKECGLIEPYNIMIVS